LSDNSIVQSAAPSPNAGVKRGLPTSGLPVAEESASKLWNIARLGMTTNEAFAKQLGRKAASGSTWDTTIALLRGLGLVRHDGGQIGLSPLGQQLVNISNPDAQVEARRTALLNLKAYRELVDSFAGTELPELSVLASRLQYDYGKSTDLAMKAAEAFIESVRHADMVDGNNVLHRGGTSASTASLQVDVTYPGDPLVEEEMAAAEIDRAFEAEAEANEEEFGEEPWDDVAEVQPTGMTVAVSVTLDLSRYRADEVVQILRALNGR